MTQKNASCDVPDTAFLIEIRMQSLGHKKEDNKRYRTRNRNINRTGNRTRTRNMTRKRARNRRRTWNRNRNKNITMSTEEDMYGNLCCRAKAFFAGARETCLGWIRFRSVLID